jgi:hypothetical protein
MRNRWYELTPDVCIVISKIECAKEEDRTRYAKLILSELRMAGYEPNRQIYLDRIRSYDMRRWYDKNRFLFMAFEYLKDADASIKSTVSNNVLRYIRQENVA